MCVCGASPLFLGYQFNALFNYKKSELLAYRSRSQVYRMKEDHWIDDYLQMIDGKTYLHMEGPRGKPSLARHIMGIIDWRCSNTIIDFDPKKYIQDEAKRLNSQQKVNP